MANFKTRLKGRQEVADATFAFRFEKPEGFEFKAGQFLTWSLIDPVETDAEGSRRIFSIASACYEDDLMMTTRMRDTAFKRSLRVMPEGAEIAINGPLGKLTLPEDESRPLVLLAGGIGITPFRSMALEATRTRPGQEIFLFYSNRRLTDAAFFDELGELEKINPRYKFIGTLSAPDQTWQGERGRIDREMIARHVQDLSAPIFYVAGPAAMTEALKGMLAEAGISGDNVRSEKFTGY
jgi:ferredoxin-NADP reductase